MNKTPLQIAVVGPSGRGKTMSFRNLNPKTTGFINMEGKILPFLNKFENFFTPNNWQDAYKKLIEYAKNDAIKVVIFDSFSAFIESLLRTARETKRGFIH